MMSGKIREFMTEETMLLLREVMLLNIISTFMYRISIHFLSYTSPLCPPSKNVSLFFIVSSWHGLDGIDCHRAVAFQIRKGILTS